MKERAELEAEETGYKLIIRHDPNIIIGYGTLGMCIIRNDPNIIIGYGTLGMCIIRHDPNIII